MDTNILKFENPKSDFANLFRLLEKYAGDVKERYKGKLIQDDKKATGNLINSIATNVTFGDLVFTVSMDLEDYWYYVEHGRKAGKWPPRDKILEWIRVKPVIPYPTPSGKLPTQEQLAFLISRKIGTQGIKEGRQLANTLEGLNQQYLPLLEKALEDDWVNNHSIQVFDVVNGIMSTIG